MGEEGEGGRRQNRATKEREVDQGKTFPEPSKDLHGS